MAIWAHTWILYMTSKSSSKYLLLVFLIPLLAGSAYSQEDDDEDTQTNRKLISWRILGGAALSHKRFFNDISERQKQQFAAHQLQITNDAYSPQFHIGFGLEIELPARLFVCLDGRITYFRTSESKKIDSDFTNFLQTALLIIPIDDLNVSMVGTFYGLTANGTVGYRIPVSQDFEIRPFSRFGIGRGSYSEDWSVTGISNTESTIDYNGSGLFIDFSGGLELLLSQSMFVDFNLGYRSFSGGSLERSIKNPATSINQNTINNNANLSALYAGLTVGARI